MLAFDLSLLYHCDVNTPTMRSRSFLPSGYGPFIQAKCKDNGLERTSIGKQCDHFHHRFLLCPQTLHHRPSVCTKSLFTDTTPISWPFATMDTDIACPDFPSCRTLLIGAKLMRRVQRLCCV